MANETELEKIDRAAEYFERYFEFEDAVTVSKENKEYLKTYIHDNDYVVKNFNIKNKIIKAVGISAAIGVAAFLLLWLLLGTKRINEQIIMLDDRIKQVERQRDDYYKALEKRVPFMSLDYMKNVQQIKQFLVDGKADTCEEAVDMFEESMLLQQMTDIMTKSETIEPVKDDKERFGDPLKIIKENKKKRKKEKKAKKTKSNLRPQQHFTPLRSFCEDPQFAIDRIIYEREKRYSDKNMGSSCPCVHMLCCGEVHFPV